jgi:NAD(P)-dependent dehydrogenase (short-subunit alcohol dehydrogenase family)
LDGPAAQALGGLGLPTDYSWRIRVAVVTGGSTGIGKAVAVRLSARGWRCVIVARGRERLEATADEIGAELEVCDVSDRVAVDQTALRVAERHRAVHLLVNNAGMPAGGGFLDLPPERIEQVTRTNYLGGVWCTRAFLPLLARAAPADVVNVVSVAGAVAVGAFGPYAASKHAQMAFSRSVGAELAPHRIRVHTIAPGPAETESFPQRQHLASPVGRVVVQPGRVADAVVGAVERGRTEEFVPRFWRLAAITAALAPATLTRLANRRGPRR